MEPNSSLHDRKPLASNVQFPDGNSYVGYIIDLLNDLAHSLDVTFEVRPSADGKYGYKEGNSWNGMIGELVRGQADMAAADLTVTAERSLVIDFTQPFMTRRMGLLVKKPCDGSVVKLEDILPDHLDKPSEYQFITIENGATYQFLTVNAYLIAPDLHESLNTFDWPVHYTSSRESRPAEVLC